MIGTSLNVHPAAMLPTSLPEGRPRLFVNRDEVGDLDRKADVVCLGDTEGITRTLCTIAGWRADVKRVLSKACQKIVGKKSNKA